MACRFCGHILMVPFLDLGTAPPSNAYLTVAALREPEAWYPLRCVVCTHCWLVQTADPIDPKRLFTDDYGFFSSVSSTWTAHAERFVEQFVARFGLNAKSRVLEIAANDGCLLERVAARGIHCLGVEPTAATAAAARGRGLEIVEAFFGNTLARKLLSEHGPFDLVIANNVLAHVPAILDFAEGIATVLAPAGVASIEFQWVVNMVSSGQFDTAYHEHYSYLSLTAVERILAAAGLRAFDVEEVPTHGGSLRVLVELTGNGQREVTGGLAATRDRERALGVASADFYAGLQARAERCKNALLATLIDARANGRSVAAYGAAAKGNTLLNFAGVRPDLLPYVVDRSPGKAGRFLPGSRIPVVGVQRLKEDRPELILILPWNLREEIAAQLSYARAWGARFVTAIPTLEIL